MKTIIEHHRLVGLKKQRTLSREGKTKEQRKEDDSEATWHELEKEITELKKEILEVIAKDDKTKRNDQPAMFYEISSKDMKKSVTSITEALI